tara:strand:- start:81 stop:302 length:222 start_codon:yes stop_codon:yes gene_type:complete
MRKNNPSFTIQLPKKSSEYIVAALTGEEVEISGDLIKVEINSLKDMRSRWNTIMRTIEVSYTVLQTTGVGKNE